MKCLHAPQRMKYSFISDIFPQHSDQATMLTFHSKLYNLTLMKFAEHIYMSIVVYPISYPKYFVYVLYFSSSTLLVLDIK